MKTKKSSGRRDAGNIGLLIPMDAKDAVKVIDNDKDENHK